MGIIIEIPKKTFFKRWNHKLFHCPTFWNVKGRFKAKYACSICGSGYRCYWDAHDIEGYGIDICDNCAKKINQNK